MSLFSFFLQIVLERMAPLSLTQCIWLAAVQLLPVQPEQACSSVSLQASQADWPWLHCVNGWAV